MFFSELPYHLKTQNPFCRPCVELINYSISGSVGKKQGYELEHCGFER